MSDQERKKIRFVFYSRWFLAIGLVVLIFLASVYFRAWYQEYQINQEISNLQTQIQNLETKKIQTLELLKYVQSNDFIETKARTELNMAKEGEQTAIIVGSGDKQTNGQADGLVVESNNQNNIIKWWKYFFN